MQNLNKGVYTKFSKDSTLVTLVTPNFSSLLPAGLRAPALKLWRQRAAKVSGDGTQAGLSSLKNPYILIHFINFINYFHDMYDILEKCRLFKGIGVDEIKDLLSRIIFQVKNYVKDDLIALSGDEIISQMIIIEGSVKGEMVDFTGKTIKIEDIESPRALAPAFLFAADNTYPVDIIANNKASILIIPRKDFLKLMSISEKVLSNYLGIISSRAQFLSGKLRFLSFQSIKGKIAHYLLELSSRSGKDQIILNKSQTELAGLFGIARPSFARALREMNNDGLIRAKGKEIKLLDRRKLSELLK